MRYGCVTQRVWEQLQAEAEAAYERAIAMEAQAWQAYVEYQQDNARRALARYLCDD